MKLCKDCEHFHILCEYENPYEWGEAVCEKHNLITYFRSKKKFEIFCCIEEEESREEDRMTNAEAVNWLINITADIGKAEHSDLWHYEQALSEIREMLEDAQPKRTEERTETHDWIPVTEAMPEEDYCTGRGIQHSESVLVTVVHHANDDDMFVDMACTVDGKWQLTYPIDDDPDIPKWCEIIAWMPLPEPYKEEQNGKTV